MSKIDVENLSMGERLKRGMGSSKKKLKKTESIDENQIFKKRANKNRPREMSSKIPPPSEFRKAPPRGRDPRFDSLCGEFNEQQFKDSYSFLTEIQQKEIAALKKALKEEEDGEKKQKIKALLKKHKDRALEKEKIEKKKQKEIESAEKIKEKLREGKPARFRSKSEKQIADLVDKYEELKSNKKVQQYLKKKAKKMKSKKQFEGYNP